VFLKRIVLHGFKSFADRTEFEFGSGITAIVGPNGCGKSNILDALRWVLGEQSAHSLRGGHMQDVIFAGSRSRKPAGLAQVQLTFDNRAGILRSDLPEVTIERMLYRSGESEYRLNGNACRLKDIRDLLLDTGVGVDAYSVIEQGRVDLLLQADPVQRREIFEEAAGISRYKVRRAEAERKLERTQENLLRLEDILGELEKRLRSVRLAAGKARNYQQYDARLRELRASFSMAEYHEFELSRRRVQEEADGLALALQERRAGLATKDAEVAETEHALQRLDDEIQAADGRLLELQTALSALAERIAQGERRLADLAAARDRRRQQAADVRAGLAGLQERIAGQEHALQELLTTEAQSAARVAAAQTARQAAAERSTGARSALERERVASFEAVRRAALLQNEQANLEQHEKRLAAQLERHAARRRDIERERDTLAQRGAELAARAGDLDRCMTEQSGELRELETQQAALGDEAERLEGESGAAKEARSAALSRLGLLEDLERRLEGVDEGTRAVLAWRDAADGRPIVPGLAADLLRIDDPRLALLQAVLATFENHVVVRDMTALLAELARRGDLPGPLRVVALDRLPARPAPVGYETTPGFVARAADWVKCAPEFRPLAEHLLGRTIVVDTLDRALRLAGEALAGYVFVTLDRRTVWPDGRVTFGAAGVAAGLISRKAEIRQLRGELDELETGLERLTRRRGEVERAAADAQLQRQGRLERIAGLQREHAELRTEQARIEDGRQRLEREAGLVAGELAAVERALAEVGQQRREFGAESEQAGAAQRTHESQIDALARELDELEAAIARLAQESTAALVEQERVAQRRAAAGQALDELRARAAALERDKADTEREADEAVRQSAALESELAEARTRRAADVVECERQQRAVLQQREARQQLRQRLEECGAARRELEKQAGEAETALHERQVALREIEVRKEGLAARVRDELGLDLAALYATDQPSAQDWTAIQAEIEELRGRIARLGNVNLDALAELEELAPRYEHLAAQRTDLQDSIARLNALIAELDQESRTRFAQAFEQIRANFQEMFRKLFGGGKADVVLEQPEDPLACGIEIIARPPGKEPQSISLLSGGEKTMTAVALLMAVFESRPSPFAFLDEVDAALDESNIDRFNNVVQEFLSRSQFVVITHSKRTMASADVLYGITMEEPGVSKRISVRFEERVQTPNVA